MNSKRCKRIRQAMRKRGLDPRQRSYRAVVVKTVIVPTGELEADGTPLVMEVPRITMILTEGTGRHIYKQAKAA